MFGGDGASFAVPPQDLDRARDALAATATWVKADLDLVMRVALVPVSSVRAQALDVRVVRYAPSPNLSYAMFSELRLRRHGYGDSLLFSELKDGELGSE